MTSSAQETAVADRVRRKFDALCLEGHAPNEAAVLALQAAQAEVAAEHEAAEQTEAIVGELAAVGLDLELARALVESSGGGVSRELAAQLTEELEPANVVALECGGELPTLSASETSVGDVVVLVQGSSAASSAVHEDPAGETREVRGCARLGGFGEHTLHVGGGASGSVALRVLAVSPTYVLARAIEAVFDTLLHHWEDAWWCDEVEAALCALLVSVEEELGGFAASFAPLMRAFDPEGGGGDLHDLMDASKRELAAALTQRSGAAVGRLHSTLSQFLTAGFLAMLPAGFGASLSAFDELRWRLATPALRAPMQSLRAAIPPYLAHVAAGAGAAAAGARLARLHAHLQDHAERGAPLQPRLFWSLLGENPLEMLGGGAAATGGGGGGGGGVRLLCCMPVVPMAATRSSAQLDGWARDLSEGLVREAVMLGSFGLGHALTPGAEGESAALLGALLAASFGYVTNGNRVLPVLPMRRAALVLPAAPPRPLLSRRRDVARVLRNGLGGRQLQLRVNTDLPTACARLKQHHPTSWVGPVLERLWAAMQRAGLLTVLELFLDGEMVAADFGHAVGGAFYVATRWHDAAHAKLQLGFVLALASARLLARLGFTLWDLGGTDGSAMMRYKASVAEVMERPAFARAFERARHAPPPSRCFSRCHLVS